jgi:hypothetical protein
MASDEHPNAGPVAGRPLPWRLRKKKTARALLYGSALALGAVGWFVAGLVREDARQQGLLTRVNGIEMAVRETDPELALRLLRDDVLAREPNDDVRRRARLAEAAALDTLRRFDDAEAAYGRLRSDWPSAIPIGALTLPWANMRVRAGRPAEALALLDPAGATAGESAEDVEAVRSAARRATPVERR